MTSLLGKRKRRKGTVERSVEVDHAEHNEHLQALLQKHFESKFKPLEVDTFGTAGIVDHEDREESAAESDDDWEGISDNSGPETVEFSQQDLKDSADLWREKQERRLFMSNKPPSNISAKTKFGSRPREDATTENAIEAKNTKNDLALHRLLRESSILKASRTDAHGTMPSAVHPSEDSVTGLLELRGSDRHKAVDLRLQSLGAKESMFKQKKMPLNHRLGIIEKRRTQERERRSEARENGIVLERATRRRLEGSASTRRERGVGGPGVGRMKGGTLMLSRNDMRSITGNESSSKRAEGKRRR